MLNWISSACIVLAGQAGPLYVNTTISMVLPDVPVEDFLGFYQSPSPNLMTVTPVEVNNNSFCSEVIQ